MHVRALKLAKIKGTSHVNALLRLSKVGSSSFVRELTCSTFNLTLFFLAVVIKYVAGIKCTEFSLRTKCRNRTELKMSRKSRRANPSPWDYCSRGKQTEGGGKEGGPSSPAAPVPTPPSPASSRPAAYSAGGTVARPARRQVREPFEGRFMAYTQRLASSGGAREGGAPWLSTLLAGVTRQVFSAKP